MMVAADERGHHSCGSGMLDAVVCALAAGAPARDPEILAETGGSALVDGGGCLGGHAGAFCMRLAIKKAAESGVGCVSCRNSGSFGFAGFYSLMAAEAGCVGLCAGNAPPSVVPTRAAKPALGDNPFSCAALGDTSCASPFLFVGGAAAASRGEVQRRAREGLNLPRGWGLDASGAETRDPLEVLERGGLMPLGGDEERGGYKGYCLGVMAEVLCSCLSGGKAGPEMRLWRDQPPEEQADLSHFFLALDAKTLNPDFPSSLGRLAAKMRALPHAGPRVAVPRGTKKAKTAALHPGEVAYEPGTWRFAGSWARSSG